MALRFYLSAVVGSGAPGDPFRPRIAQLAAEHGVSLRWGADDGRVDSTQGGGWMVVWCDVTDAQHDVARVDPGIRWIPFEDSAGNALGPDALVGELDPTRRSQIRTWLEERHVPIDDLTLTDPLRKVVGRVVRRIRVRRALQRRIAGVLSDEDFREGLDTQVKNIPGGRRSTINSRLQERGYDTSVIVPNDTLREALQKLAGQDVAPNRNGWG